MTPEEDAFSKWLDDQIEYHKSMSEAYKRRARVGWILMCIQAVLIGVLFWSQVRHLF